MEEERLVRVLDLAGRGHYAHTPNAQERHGPELHMSAAIHGACSQKLAGSNGFDDKTTTERALTGSTGFPTEIESNRGSLAGRMSRSSRGRIPHHRKGSVWHPGTHQRLQQPDRIGRAAGARIVLGVRQHDRLPSGTPHGFDHSFVGIVN